MTPSATVARRTDFLIIFLLDPESQVLIGHMFHDVLSLAPSPSPGTEPNTEGLARWIRDIFGPIFLVIVSIVAIFFLFTREITRFVQFILLAIAVGVIFYVPNIIEVVALGIARALGVDG